MASLITYTTQKQLDKLRGKREMPIRIKVRRKRGEPQVEVNGLLSVGVEVVGAGKGWVAEASEGYETPDELYERYVNELESELGSDATSGAELDKVGKRLGDGWVGVFAADEKIPPRDKSRTLLAIKNTDTRESGGEHWYAIARTPTEDIVYDSFGRSVYVGGKRVKTPENDAEQVFNEENCGQRCLAWLFVLRKRGTEAAMQI